MAEPRAERDLWIFAYGSLMWRPGFPFVRSAQARLDGFHRCFCVYTVHHRGTRDRPGLVLGLDRGGTCQGIAYLVAAEHVSSTRAYLAEREYADGSYPYREAQLPITLLQPGRAQVLALTYLVERGHPGYAGRLPLPTQAHLIRGAKGISGGNIDYLLSTIAHLTALGIAERELARLIGKVAPHLATGRIGFRGTGSAGIRSSVRRLPFEAPRLRPVERRRFMHRRHMVAWVAEAWAAKK